jgi:MSHA biogenesis protein MshO
MTGACPRQAAGFAPRQRGVTLVEMVTVVLISGIVLAVVAVFIQKPVEGYFDTVRRAELSDTAETALRRITRDLRLALPNSVRVSGNYLEYLETTGGGRYRAAATAGGTGDALDFSAAGGDASFDVIGPVPPASPGMHVVIFNLGPGFADADAYQSAGNNRATITAVTGGGVGLAAPKRFPFESPGRRFHVVTGPVTYECDPAAGALRRYAGYAIGATQPTPPAGARVALLATNVSNCAFQYDPNVLAQRYGIVGIRLTLAKDGEAASLYAQAHVPNIP